MFGVIDLELNSYDELLPRTFSSTSRELLINNSTCMGITQVTRISVRFLLRCSLGNVGSSPKPEASMTPAPLCGAKLFQNKASFLDCCPWWSYYPVEKVFEFAISALPVQLILILHGVRSSWTEHRALMSCRRIIWVFSFQSWLLFPIKYNPRFHFKKEVSL